VHLHPNAENLAGNRNRQALILSVTFWSASFAKLWNSIAVEEDSSTITVPEDKGRNNGYGRSTADTGRVATNKSATQTEKSLKGFWTEGDPSKRGSSARSTRQAAALGAQILGG
jgi:hypothetical protein